MIMGKTIVEKIIAKKVGVPEVKPGEYVKFGIDTVIQVGSDIGALNANEYKHLGWDKLFDPKKVMIAPEHCGSWSRPQDSITNRESHRQTVEWAKSLGVPDENILELGRVGTCHHIPIEMAWALPGGVYLHIDTHCPTVGGVGCLGINLSAAETSFLRLGWMWFRVPKSIKFEISGKLQNGVYGRDVFEYILGQIGPAGAVYQAMEYTGSVVEDMSMDGRLTMCCLSIFTGAKTGIVAPDQKVIDWFKARTKVPFEPQYSDKDAEYAKVYKYDGSKIEPQVVVPPYRRTVVPVSQAVGTKITSAFIGSCASGRDEDLRVAAKILKGKKVAPGVMFNVTPGSSDTMLRSDKEGVIHTLLEAGAFVCAPSCSMCPGFYTPLAKNEVCIASSTTNVPGRMGDESAQVYLGSPATVAASALEGKIADPRKYM
jgi:3-isopropylmalate/(R)-2-methylmalate dehydratase large subunit